MNFALPQQPAARHPAGLAIVIGLHVLLAAVLVTAKMARTPSEPPPVVLTALDPVKPPKIEPKVLPDPVQPKLPTLVIPTPPIPINPTPDVIVAKVDDHPQKTEVIVDAGGKHDDDTVHQVARTLARAARIDAGAAQCRPEYPAAAQRAGATGITRIRFTVDASGRVVGSQVLQPSGSTRENRLMDKAAADALAQCPVQVGTDETGRAVGTTTDVEYVWKLD